MKRLHVGSGKIKLDGYINIDIEPSHNPDLCIDILKGEFEENSIDVIYACHFYEHLGYPNDAVKCLGLFYKWLKADGILRLAVPDLEKAVLLYHNDGDLTPLYGKDFKGYYHKDTKCERLNFFVKAWNHQLCYDFELLDLLLVDAGFRYIQERAANGSNIPDFNHDRFISESLYVECVK